MKLTKIVTAVLVAVTVGIFDQSAQAAPFTGTTSAYYLNNWADNRIYVVQGTSVIYSFVKTRSGSTEEGILAVSNGVISTKSFFGYQGSGTTAGQYTTSGTAIGPGYAANTTPSGTSSANSYDGTSSGTNNFAVEYLNNLNSERVVQYDLTWQNPVPIFTTVNSGSGQQLSIAYDPLNNSLWIGGWGTSLLSNYSMTGTLLSSFDVGHGFNSALGFDAADGTLWLDWGQGNNFQQWSTTGALLQSGSFTGLASGNFLSGEFEVHAQSPVPAPGALALLALGLFGIGGLRRKRIAA